MTKPAMNLFPVHHSLKRNLRMPNKMERVQVDDETKLALMNVSQSIFQDASAVGYTFQECLMAIYLSGLQHGSVIANERNNN